MNNQNLIICDHKILDNIFYELKDFLNFDVTMKSKSEILGIMPNDNNNYIVLTMQLMPSVDNQFLLEKLPFKFFKLLEKINIMFLKQKFNEQSNIKITDYVLNLNSREIISKNKKLRLTEKEITIILFLSNNGNEVSVMDLQTKVWGYQKELETHTVETHIHRLRKKMFENFGDNKFITSKKNGYQIN